MLVLTLRLGVGFFKVNRYLVWNRGAIMQTWEQPLRFFMHFWQLFTMSGWMFESKGVRWVEKYGVCEYRCGCKSSSIILLHAEMLQIKHSCFLGGNYGLTPCSISGDSDLISLCRLYCKMSLSCCMYGVFFPRSNCENWIWIEYDTSIRFATLCYSLCSCSVCVCFWQRDNCIRWCWDVWED